MKVNLGVAGWAVSGTGAEAAPEACREALPPPGTRRRGGRAPLLAAALCRRAIATAEPQQAPDLDQAGVLFGSGLGCLTETQLFVEHMIDADEATPKPRAFSSSVHNAIASKVALDLGAHGECQTFVHGEVSFAHALFAAARTQSRSPSPLLVGAVDERTEYVQRGLLACGAAADRSEHLGEGGAALLLTESATVRITDVAFGRPRDPMAWLHDTVAQPGALLSIASLRGDDAHLPTTWPIHGVHSSALASAVALAAGVLSGTVDTDTLGFADTPSRITLLGRSRFGDSALISLHVEAL